MYLLLYNNRGQILDQIDYMRQVHRIDIEYENIRLSITEYTNALMIVNYAPLILKHCFNRLLNENKADIEVYQEVSWCESILKNLPYVIDIYLNDVCEDSIKSLIAYSNKLPQNKHKHDDSILSNLHLKKQNQSKAFLHFKSISYTH